MRKLIYIFGITALLVACGSEAEPEVRPAAVLEQDEFTDVMVDVSLIQAVYNRELALEDESEAKKNSYEHYAEIWAKYEIDADVFKASFNWYSRHEPQMLEIYEDVLEQLATVAEE
jgi:hypothetical protein